MFRSHKILLALLNHLLHFFVKAQNRDLLSQVFLLYGKQDGLASIKEFEFILVNFEDIYYRLEEFSLHANGIAREMHISIEQGRHEKILKEEEGGDLSVFSN